MCWMCDKDAKSSVVSNYTSGQDALAGLHFSRAADKATDGLWLTGHELAPQQAPALILIGDTVPGDTSTTATLTVDAPHTIGTTETIGDEDFYKVQLVAGQDYEIGMYAYVGGPGGVPQADAYIEIYDAAGNLITSADGGASTLYNNGNSGFDVLTTFTPKVSGTYYVNARAYDEEPTNGTTGDTVGDYELFVQTASPFAYKPYYDLDSPLHSIDWGSQVDGSSRNPDGAEGPRPTGNEFIGHASNPYGIVGKNVITYYFARQGEVFIDEDPTTPGSTDTIVASGFEDWEKDVYLNAFGAYSKVADIVYIEVDNRAEADFVLITYEGTPGPGASLLGRMSPPDEENEGRTEFNANDERWTEEGLAPGGFSFTTLIHEFGHGHGLAHPHDNGGHSSIMRGVESDGVAFSYTNGDFDLNQSVYTMMSYEDGWEKSPYGQAETTDPYGWLGSLMAFDVAAIQDKYGVNEEWATGNNTYQLKDVNAPGTFYSCIWDAGGTDSIVYTGSRDANIDLRAATLKYEPGGGGWISYAYGIHGGFTIANGVTIENASSGSGKDTLTGNNAHNSLSSGAGNDVLTGAAGSDILNGGLGADKMTGGTGHDTFYVNHTSDKVIEVGNQGTDTIRSSISYDLITHVENLVLIGTANITGRGNTAANNITGNSGSNLLNGGVGNDVINGGAGNDLIYGSDGRDTLTGGAGDDRFAFATALSAGNVDDILDFSVADDQISLANYIFTNAGPNGVLKSYAFRVGTAAGDATDRIIYDPASGKILYDPDGAGGAAAVHFATVDSGTALTHADFYVYG